MFTGLIQSIGEVSFYAEHQIAIRCPVLEPDLAIGDSVAVNGVCLTVVEVMTDGFTADVSPETRKRTNLAERATKRVNLETALTVGSKLGGHFVSGHIDGIGTLTEVKAAGGGWELSFSAPPEVGRYLIYKGSIAVNGVSLTVARCNELGTEFTTAVIPHTFDRTNLKLLAIGSKVNLEADILGKYVEKLLRMGILNNKIETPPDITLEFLSEHGWR